MLWTFETYVVMPSPTAPSSICATALKPPADVQQNAVTLSHTRVQQSILLNKTDDRN